MKRVVAIVLGAGCASRMGRCKLSVPYKGTPLVRHALRAIEASEGIDEVVLVVQPGVRLAEDFDWGGRLVENPRWEEGMSTSLAVGVRAVRADMYLLFLADMPEVPASLAARLIAAHARTGKPIVHPVYQGRRGHPVLVAASLRDHLLAITGDKGPRHLIRDHPEWVERVEVDDAGVLFDVDSPEDLK